MSGTSRTPASGSTGRDTGRQWGWLIPGVTFLVGIVLGGAVVFAQQSGPDTASPSTGTGTPSSSVTATSTDAASSPVAVVRVPQACLSVADDSQALVDVAGRAVTAARDLDAAALATAVRQLDAAQKVVSASASACREVQATLPTVSAEGGAGTSSTTG